MMPFDDPIAAEIDALLIGPGPVAGPPNNNGIVMPPMGGPGGPMPPSGMPGLPPHGLGPDVMQGAAQSGGPPPDVLQGAGQPPQAVQLIRGKDGRIAAAQVGDRMIAFNRDPDGRIAGFEVVRGEPMPQGPSPVELPPPDMLCPPPGPAGPPPFNPMAAA